MVGERDDLRALGRIVEDCILVGRIGIVDVHDAEVGTQQTRGVETDLVELRARGHLDSISQLMRVLVADQLGRHGSRGHAACHFLSAFIESDVHHFEHVCAQGATLGGHDKSRLEGLAAVGDHFLLLLDTAKVGVAEIDATKIGGKAIEFGGNNVGRVFDDGEDIQAETAAIAQLVGGLGGIGIDEGHLLLLYRLVVSTIVDSDLLRAAVRIRQLHADRRLGAITLQIGFGLAEIEGIVGLVKRHIIVGRADHLPRGVGIVLLVPVELILLLAAANVESSGRAHGA